MKKIKVHHLIKLITVPDNKLAKLESSDEESGGGAEVGVV